MCVGVGVCVGVCLFILRCRCSLVVQAPTGCIVGLKSIDISIGGFLIKNICDVDIMVNKKCTECITKYKNI